MPYIPITLKSQKLKHSFENPQTIGEHVKQVRVLRRLSQAQAATLVGVDQFTVLNWEKNRTEPMVTSVPDIIRFLGYDPYPEPEALAERMLAKRQAMGWTIKQAARELGVDEGTWGAWERGIIIPWPRYQQMLDKFLVVEAVHPINSNVKSHGRLK